MPILTLVSGNREQKWKKPKEDKAQNAYKQLTVTRSASANRVFCRIALALPIPCSWLGCTYIAWGFPTATPSLLQHTSGLHTLIYRICSPLWVQAWDIARNIWCKLRIWSTFLHLSSALHSWCVVPPIDTSMGDITPSAWGTASDPLCIHHGWKSTWRWSITTEFSITWWWSPQIQINIIKSKAFQLITFIM